MRNSKDKDSIRAISEEIHKKIVDLDVLKKHILRARKKSKCLVMSHGAFDLLHPGHFYHLESARKMGDLLIVTIDSDLNIPKGPGRPVFNERLRSESLAALTMVDYVLINPFQNVIELIQELKPDIYAKGAEYLASENQQEVSLEEEQAVKDSNGRVEYTRDVSFSSSHLLNHYFPVLTQEAEQFLSRFRKRFPYNRIQREMKKLKNLKVMVIGDAIIDEYHYAEAMGKPSKSACVSARFVNDEQFIGGALSIANHTAGFVSDVHLVSCLGKLNSHEPFICSKLKENVTSHFVYRADGPTIIKRRYVNPFRLEKMFEISIMNDHNLEDTIENELVDYLEQIVHQYDVVIVSDFGHGFLGKKAIRALARNANYLAVNAQANSANMGFNVVTKYPKADYVSIDEREIRLASHSKHGSIQEMIQKLAHQLKSNLISITLGENGSIVFDSHEKFYDTPVFSNSIVDTVGAGDAYLSITSLLAAQKCNPELIGFIGNAVGALAVRIVGNKEWVEPEQLDTFVHTLLK